MAIGQNLQFFTGSSDVYIWVNLFSVGTIDPKQTNEYKYALFSRVRKILQSIASSDFKRVKITWIPLYMINVRVFELTRIYRHVVIDTVAVNITSRHGWISLRLTCKHLFKCLIRIHSPTHWHTCRVHGTWYLFSKSVLMIQHIYLQTYHSTVFVFFFALGQQSQREWSVPCVHLGISSNSFNCDWCRFILYI